MRACILPSVYTSPHVVQSGPNLAHTHMYADSSPKGSGPNTKLACVTQVAFNGFYQTKQLDRLAPNCLSRFRGPLGVF